MLGGIQSPKELSLLVRTFGSRLTLLKVETVLATIPLDVVGNCCTLLAELQIINSRISTGDHECDKGNQPFFAHLRLVYFFFVNYQTTNGGRQPYSALHCILKHARHLEGIQATGTSTLSDDCLYTILAFNPLLSLKRLVLTDACNSQMDNLGSSGNILPRSTGSNLASSRPNLSVEAVVRLFATCPMLHSVGDLRHWALSQGQKRDICKQISSALGGHWLLNSFES